MSRMPLGFAGLIRLYRQPDCNPSSSRCDDSTLDSLLRALVHHHLAERPTSNRLSAIFATANTGYLRFTQGQASLDANLDRLSQDLQAEYDQLEGLAT